MITRISTVARRSRVGVLYPSRARFLSTGTSQASPSPKICVLPFRQNPAAVAERFHTFALILSAQMGNFFVASLRMAFGPIGAWIARTLNMGGPMRLREMKAVYYPVWRTDVIYEGKVKRVHKDKIVDGLIGAQQAYVPGNSFAPLSYLSFAQPILEDELPVYDPDIHLHQLGDGYEIVPVPFTASPLGLLKRIEDVVGPSPRFEDLTFDKSTWKPTLVACYPVMYPIYIADFEYESADGEPRSMNLIMDAHGESLRKCRISGPPAPEVAEQTPRLKNNYFMNPSTFVPNLTVDPLPDGSGEAAEDEGPTKFTIKIEFGRPPPSSLAQVYDSWMSPKPISAQSIAPSPMLEVEQEEGGVDWEDPRIQSWNSEERYENEEFYDAVMVAKMAKSRQTARKQLKHDVEAFERKGNSLSEDERKAKEMKEFMLEMLEKGDGAEDALKTREEAKPAWLKAFEESQSGEQVKSTTGTSAARRRQKK